MEKYQELIKAYEEGRVVIFENYPIVSIYNPKDEDGFYTKTVTGVIKEDEYLKMIKE